MSLPLVVRLEGTNVEQGRALLGSSGLTLTTATDLTDAALLYVYIYAQPEQTPYQKMLVREPMVPAYERLHFTDLIDVAVLPPILDMMDVLIGELRKARAVAARRCEADAADVRSPSECFRTDKESEKERKG